MATLLVGTPKGQHWLTVEGAQSLREALEETEARVPTACGGVGTCGACVVRVVSGQTNPPTAAERRKLTGEERARGLRLACQLRVEDDLEIELEQPEKPTSWVSIPLEELPRWTGRHRPPGNPVLLIRRPSPAASATKTIKSKKPVRNCEER